jgi:23S rRNA (cytosine1962-C5)-methyltransferase
MDGALARRRLLGPFDPYGAERLIFSESDLMSGLIVDRYADCLGVQFTSAGLLKWREPILQHLQAATGARAIMVRMDDKTARHEGVEPLQAWHGGVELSAPIPFHLNGLQLSVDLRSGQKTGSYLDQRCNHVAVAQYLVGRRVLDVCSYTGGFGLVAAKAGATSITAIDSSLAAVQEGRRAAERNGIHNLEFVVGDCFDTLETLRRDGEQFGGVILDPPRFAGSRHEIEKALRAYSRLNSLAVDLLPPGGILATCSCSGRVSRTDFLNMLVDVARRRHRDLIVLEQRGPAPDHPMAISCPESDYLKCVIAQVC